MLDDLFEKAAFPLLRFRTAATYSPRLIEERVEEVAELLDKIRPPLNTRTDAQIAAQIPQVNLLMEGRGCLTYLPEWRPASEVSKASRRQAGRLSYIAHISILTFSRVSRGFSSGIDSRSGFANGTWISVTYEGSS